MAISITTPTPGKFGFILNATSADISGGETLKAAPATGSIIVDHITINNGAGAQGLTIGAGLTGAAVTTALIGPVAMPVNSLIQFNFHDGMVLSAATALTCDSDSNTAVCIFVQGRVQ